MDPREAVNDQEEAHRAAMDGRQATIWTALPGYIVSFNPSAVTAQVQPGVQAIRTDTGTGETTPMNLPVIPDVPVVFPHGGGYTLTFPVKAGDECLIVFASRNIDSWWQSGGIQPPFDRRMHDISDAFAILGPMSQAHKISGISTSKVQLRSDNGSHVIEIGSAGINLTSSAPITVTATSVTVTGGDVIADGISLKNHKHGGVVTGGSNTGLPVP